MRAYRDAAGAALWQWADTVTLPEVNAVLHDSVAVYLKSCRAVTAATLPNWRTVAEPNSKELKAAYNRIDERATDLYNTNSRLKQQREQQSSMPSEKVEVMEDENEDDDEDGEIEEGEDEEGAIEEGEEDGEEEDGEAAEDELAVAAEKTVNATTVTRGTGAAGAVATAGKGKKGGGGILAKKKAGTAKTKMVNLKNKKLPTTPSAAAAASRGRRGRSRGGGRGGSNVS